MARMLKEEAVMFNRLRSVYPWARWLNGAVWELELGKDFATIVSFRPAAYMAAMRYGGKLRTTMKQNGNLIIQFYKNGAE